MELTEHPHAQIKRQIRADILTKFGSIAKFIDAHPQAKFNPVSISQWLDPKRGCTMNSLQRLCDALDIQMVLTRKRTAPELFTHDEL